MGQKRWRCLRFPAQLGIPRAPIGATGGFFMKRFASYLGVTALSTMVGATELLAGVKTHRHANALDIAGIGLVAALMVGGAGYFLLRRRTQLEK
jgi:hypothetical protein